MSPQRTEEMKRRQTPRGTDCRLKFPRPLQHIHIDAMSETPPIYRDSFRLTNLLLLRMQAPFKPLINLVLCCAQSLSRVQPLANCQAPLSMGILQVRILEWVAMLSSRGSSQSRDQTHVSCIGKQISLPLNHLGSPGQPITGMNSASPWASHSRLGSH